MYKELGLSILTGLVIVGCGGGGGGDITRDTDAIFPHSYEIASLGEETEDVALIGGIDTRATEPSDILSTIDNILDGKTDLKDIFTPELIYTHSKDAVCYGPTMMYDNHPDGITPNTGELPSGDLGIWTMNEGNTTEACTAAELNARMTGVRKRSMSSLFLLASSLDAMYDAGMSLPAVASSINLTTIMPTIPNVTFSLVTISHVTSSDYLYTINFTYTRAGMPYNISFTILHKAGGSKDEYKGLITYQIEDSMTGGNCAMGLPTPSPITKKGSIVYERTSTDDFATDAREADFCGHNLVTGFNVDGLLDPTYRFDPTTRPDGWGNNYTRFITNYKKSNLSGQYSYAWQAGPNDSHSRVLQIDLNDHPTVDGESYFGFGAQMFASTTSPGQIFGMICNWAGPGNNHTPKLFAQREFLTYSSKNGVFETSTAGADITYAPTNSCEYTAVGGFSYDRDLDKLLTVTDISVVKTGAGAGELEFDLFSSAHPTVPDMIKARGANLPNAPIWP